MQTETVASAQIVRLQSYTIGDGPSDSALHVDGVAYARYKSPRNPGPNPSAVHAWERAGLGVAPYRCVGVGTAIYKATPDAPAQPGASCDYCGQGIMNVYSVQATCKSIFKVGCDCVSKTCDKGERVRTVIESEDRKRRNAQAKASRDRRDAATMQALVDLRAANFERLASLPHPQAAKGHRYFSGLTALDWLDYMLGCCGVKGRAALLKFARALVSGVSDA